MKTPAAHDEGDPSRLKKKPFFILFFLSALFIFAAFCNHAKKDEKVKQQAADSIALKQHQQYLADSQAKADVHKKKIYLTFDDGPNDGTPNVLKAVKEEGVPVSFFIVGKHVFDTPDQAATWQQIKADNAVELCNHSYTHALNRYSSYYRHPDLVVKDIEKNNEQLGFTNPVVRMPGRNAWRIDSLSHTDIKASKPAIDSVHKAGFAIMGWDLEWIFDHKTYVLKSDADQLLRQIKYMLDTGDTKTPGHLVLLAHDQTFRSKTSLEQLHFLLKNLKNNPDYVLVLADSYPGIKK